ncbi:hypothetical protein BHM03_00061954 [Ensete ventricosum]|nr:hypothetical protein BHM03_00061954 [Ensete ventricosum]
MGLITHNRFYVCIGAPPCPVIVDLVIIGSDALTPLSPSAPPLPLCRGRLRLLTGSRLAKGWPPLRLAPLPLLATGLVASGSPLRVPCSRPPLSVLCCKRLCPRETLMPAGTGPAGCCPYGMLPLRAGAAGLPFRLALAAASNRLAGGLGRPCMGAGHGWPPLLLAAFAAKTQQEQVE